MGTGIDLAAELDALMGKNDENLGIQGFLDTGIPELNWILSGQYDGGMPWGRVIEMFGEASSGKTFLATMVMIAAQRAGGIAFFCDHERSFETKLAESIGLNLDPAHFRYIRPETIEEGFATCTSMASLVREKELIPSDAPMVWVMDSIAQAIPAEKLYDSDGNRREVGQYNMRDKLALSVAMSQGMPAVAQFCGDNNMTFLALNQIRMKPGVMYGDPTTTPGGKSMEFNASTRISIGRKEITNGKKGKDKEVLGFQITAHCTKNKVAKPFQKATWQVRFNLEGLGVSIDQVATNLDFLVRKGIIPKAGNRVEWEGKKLYQSQLERELKATSDGIEKLMALYPSGREDLEDVQESDVLPEGATMEE